MEDQKSVSKSVVTTTISALAVVATLAGSGVAWFMTQHSNQPSATKPSTVVSSGTSTLNPTQINPPVVAPLPATTTNPPIGTSPTTPNPLPTVTGTNPQPTTPSIAQNGNTVKIWRLDDNGKKTFLVPQERQVPQEGTQDPDAAVKRPLASLLASAGKPDGKLTSTIPIGTKLLSAKIQPDGIHVDLSKEFTQSAGSTSTIGRLGQVIYTATAQNPNAPVWISVEGKPLEVLGDVGVEIRQPITRKMYDQDFPINPGKSNNP
jgi:spore germination protein GerM